MTDGSIVNQALRRQYGRDVGACVHTTVA